MYAVSKVLQDKDKVVSGWSLCSVSEIISHLLVDWYWLRLQSIQLKLAVCRLLCSEYLSAALLACCFTPRVLTAGHCSASLFGFPSLKFVDITWYSFLYHLSIADHRAWSHRAWSLCHCFSTSPDLAGVSALWQSFLPCPPLFSVFVSFWRWCHDS